MKTSTVGRALPALAIAALALSTLTACGPEDQESPPAEDTFAVDTMEPDTGDDAETEEDDGGFIGVTLPGTGSYAIGTDIPYGGFQLLGEPSSQPDGCTWSIVDEDGAVFVENHGPYVFITDIPEAVTFITDGCPDWEQFE